MKDRTLQMTTVAVVICCLALMNIRCTKKYSDNHARTSALWVRNAIMYEVDLRSFSNEGAFRALQSAIPDLKKSGFTVLCLAPIYPAGELNRRGERRNSYAVRDYYGVNAEYGSLEEFDSLVSAVHNEEMKIIVDLPARYASWDSQILLEHPEWFTHNADGAIVSPDPSLPDVAGLNYDHHELRKYMIALMVHWVRDVGIDGFRCTSAESVPLDFWATARSELEKIKPIMMISDGSSPAHHMKAFDLTYSRTLYDMLKRIENDSISVESFSEILNEEIRQYPHGSLMLRRYDECCEEKAANSRTSDSRAAADAVCTFALPGVPMVCRSQVEIHKEGKELFENERQEGSKEHELMKRYERLTAFRSRHSALREGTLEWLRQSDSAHVAAFVRVAGGDTVVVIINFSKYSKGVSTAKPGGASDLWYEEFGRTIIRSNGSTLEMQLPPFGCALLYPATEGSTE